MSKLYSLKEEAKEPITVNPVAKIAATFVAFAVVGLLIGLLVLGNIAVWGEIF